MIPLRLKAALRSRFPKLWVAYAISRIGKEVELGYLSKIVPRNRQSIDVGANLGVYARALSKLTPMVHAFEPSKELALILRRTLPRNVTVHETALSDRAGRALLRTPVVDGKRIFGLASLEQHASHPRLETEIVELSRLDDLIDGDVGFIKIDVEGHELRVLTGAKSVIKQCRPVLLIECEERHNPGGPAKLFDYLGSLGYLGRFVRDGAICDIADFKVRRDQNLDSAAPYIYNFFFFPDKNIFAQRELSHEPLGVQKLQKSSSFSTPSYPELIMFTSVAKSALRP